MATWWRRLRSWLETAEPAEPPRPAQSLGRRLFPALLFPPGARFDVELRRLLLTTTNLALLATWASATFTEGPNALHGHFAAAGVGLLLTAAFPWQRLRRELYLLFALAAIAWVRAFLDATGQTGGATSLLYFFVILITTPLVPQRIATLIGLAAAFAYSLPAIERALYPPATLLDASPPASDWLVRAPLFVLMSVLMAQFGRRAGQQRAFLMAPPRPAPITTEQAAREEYISVLSHELRNPLVGIAAAAQVLSRDLPPGSVESARASAISAEATQMLSLLEEVMDVTRIDLGKLNSVLVTVDLAKVVRAAVAAQQVADRSVVLRGADDELRVLADERRIRQVVANLLGNATAYSPPGTQIEVSVGRAADSRSAIVEVRDHGPGIPPGDRDRLFTKFVRLSTAQGTRGAGLGLYICRGIIADHGGRLWADWPADGGSAFAFSLPLATGSLATVAGPRTVAG